MSDYPMLISNKLHSFRNFTSQTDIPETLVGRSDRNQRKCHEKRLERRDAKFLANLR